MKNDILYRNATRITIDNFNCIFAAYIIFTKLKSEVNKSKK